MTTYKTLTAAITAVTLGALATPAHATPSRYVAESKTQYHALPINTVITTPTVATVAVSAGVDVRPTTGNTAYYDVTGSDPSQFQIDVRATQIVVGDDGRQRTLDAPVLAYEVYLRASPESTGNDPRDDVTLLRLCHSNAYPYVQCDGNNGLVVHQDEKPQLGQYRDSGVEIVNYGTPEGSQTLLDAFTRNGPWYVFTEGRVLLQSADGPISLALPGLHSGPSYDVVTIQGVNGTLFAETPCLKEWLQSPVLFTAGGIRHPRWNEPISPDGKALQYKAGPNLGRKWAVLGTQGVDPETGYLTSQDCLNPSEPLSNPQYFERHYLVGADVGERGDGGRLVVSAFIDSVGVSPLDPRQEITALYLGREHNWGSYTVDHGGSSGGRLSLDERIILDMNHSREVVFEIGGRSLVLKLPQEANEFGVLTVLYGYASLCDKNYDGVIHGPDELTRVPFAYKYIPVEFVPRGHEPEAAAAGFVAGVLVGSLVGYNIQPPITGGGVLTPPLRQGGMGLGSGGELIE